jgi:hypothetical protein
MEAHLNSIRRRVRLCIWIIIIGLFISGVTAFPIETELAFFVKHQPESSSTLTNWLNKIYLAVKDTNTR